MLEIKNLHYYYGKIHAVKGIDLIVNQGEIVALIGANGAGKTTILQCISGVLTPQEGAILLHGERIDSLKPHHIAKKRISQVLEGRHVFPHLTVLENLRMGAYIRKNQDEINKDIEEMYELFPRLKERREQGAGSLSGGEQQMLAMARGLMSRPEILLLDEPSLGLAPILVENIFEKIIQISQMGTTILLVEQNAKITLSIANRGYVLEVGNLVLSDTGENLLKNEQVRKSYLGEK
jgi:branched-chain amino acid transport system ATP-binding protein